MSFSKDKLRNEIDHHYQYIVLYRPSPSAFLLESWVLFLILLLYDACNLFLVICFPFYKYNLDTTLNNAS